MRRVLGGLTIVGALCGTLSGSATAQDLTGALIITVKDAQGAVLPGAVIRSRRLPCWVGSRP